MININKKLLIIPAVIATVAGSSLFTSTASAQSGTNSSTLVQKIAQKFGLKEADVQTVFDQHRGEMRSIRMDKHAEMLSQAVKDGKLTENQKKLILDKMSELQSKWDSWRADNPPGSISAEEREAHKEKRQQEITELKAWAEKNGIDLKYLMGGKGMGMGKHMGRGPMW